MDEEEIVFAFVEGFLRQAIETAEEMSGGMFVISFSIEKQQVGGTNA